MFLNALVGDAGRSTHSLQEYATTSHFTNQRSDVKGISIEGRLKKKKKKQRQLLHMHTISAGSGTSKPLGGDRALYVTKVTALVSVAQQLQYDQCTLAL